MLVSVSEFGYNKVLLVPISSIVAHISGLSWFRHHRSFFCLCLREILIMNDDTNVMDSINQVLGNHNYTVRAVPPPRDIAGFVEDFYPDLMPIDFLLSSLDSATLIKILKIDRSMIDLPGIMISTYGKQIPVDVTDNYDMLLEKPFDMDGMLYEMRN